MTLRPLSAAKALGSLFALLVAAAPAQQPNGTPVPVPDGAPGVGFDDLRYSASLRRVLVPAGRSGNLVLVDPDTLAVSAVSGFSKSAEYRGGHDFGVTSVDEGKGLLFVTDRTSGRLAVVDAKASKVVGAVKIGAEPDYVRYVEATDEIWVTEPEASRIEVFSAPKSGARDPVAAATIHVDDGPESLIIDQASGRAYTHRWRASTVVLDVRTRKVVAEWPNGCASSRGLALDERRGFFFAACREGNVSVLDTKNGGRILSTFARGSGFDVMGYDAGRGHLYLAGNTCSCLVVLGVSGRGKLSFLGRFTAPQTTHCAVADGGGHAWVCDPAGGRLFRVDDPYPASFSP